MITLILMIQNQREEQILRAAFEQRGVKVILAKPTYHNYVLILQYIPDIVFMELPHICTEHLAFASRLRAFKRTKTIPIAGYGEKIDEMVKRGISQHGFTVYIERPLRYSSLLQVFSRLLKASGKSFDAPPVISDKEKDIDLIMNSAALPMQKIEAMTRHVSSLMAFPFTVAKVLQITQNERSGAQNLAHAIVSDPSISAHILKVANSVFFASSNHRINSIKDAIVRIGFNETRKIVMSMHVMKLFEKTSKTNGFDRIDFWYHSVMVGLISEKIARLFGDVNIETAFLAGLIHDLGIIMLDEYFSPMFDKALELTAQRGAHFLDIQKELYGVMHNDLIAGLFPIWKIPQEITDSILFQFRLSEFNDTFDTVGKKYTLCVAIGSIVAKALHQGRECDEFVYPLQNSLFQKACLPSGISHSFIKQVTEELTLYQSFLGLERRVFTCDVCGIEQPSDYSIAFFSPNPWIFIPLETHANYIGFKTSRIDSLSKVSNEIHCVIIWDPEGAMSFSDEKLFPDKNQDSAAGKKSKIPVIFIGATAETPEGFPEEFSYLPSSLDLRLFDITVSKLITQPDTEVQEDENRAALSDDYVTNTISDIDTSLSEIMNDKEAANESD